jgi:dinuclear metal center YbgI/SA1388 family protein
MENAVMLGVAQVVRYADNYLRIRKIDDWPNALNGLQIQNSGRITKIGAAVDVSTRVLSEAGRKGADFLIVHHGLFWQGLQAVTGALHRQLKIAYEHDMAVYSVHLPLDVHPTIGNNARLSASLGLKSMEPFLEQKNQLVGLRAKASLSRKDLVRKLKKSLGGPVKTFNFGPKRTRTVAISTGGAGSEIYRVAEEKIDTFITGEAPHWAAIAAEELGINLFLGGHYATETFGVKALAALLSKRFRVPWIFIDCPTGL